MKFKAAITVVSSDDGISTGDNNILDKIKKFNIDNVTRAEVGRFFSLEIDANSKNAAYALVEEISELLTNKELETASFNIEEI